jgi:hypothetical protein
MCTFPTNRAFTKSCRIVAALLAVASVFAAPPASASGGKRILYTVSIGQNEVSQELRNAERGLVTLRYADDDALRVYSLLGAASQRAFLLAVLDPDTQRRFPEFAGRARSPTLAEIDATIETLRVSMERDVAAGLDPILVFFFSGHGVRDEAGNAALAILDGALSQRWLYERVLPRLPARFIHLVVDACHAEAFVRPRDVDAKMESLSDTERAAYVEASTLARFPNVGAVLASSVSAQSFEWDGYQSGVFAHEFLSALRGGADVNGDGAIEYSEMAAFLAAANMRVSDPRARLSIVTQPPRVDRRAPLLEHAALSEQFTLAGRADGHWSRPFFVETARGERILDVFAERGSRIALKLPARERLYVVRADGEVSLNAKAGTHIALESLKPAPPRIRPRGSLALSMQRGLFGTRFGPTFYTGYMTDRDGFVVVPSAADIDELSHGEQTAARVSPPQVDRSGLRKPIGTALLIGAGAAAMTAGVFAGLSLDARSDYENTNVEREASEARARFYNYRAVAWGSAGMAVAFGASGAVLLFWPEASTSPSASSALRFEGVGVKGTGVTTWGSF